jgi:hypothetical protein
LFDPSSAGRTPEARPESVITAKDFLTALSVESYRFANSQVAAKDAEVAAESLRRNPKLTPVRKLHPVADYLLDFARTPAEVASFAVRDIFWKVDLLDAASILAHETYSLAKKSWRLVGIPSAARWHTNMPRPIANAAAQDKLFSDRYTESLPLTGAEADIALNNAREILRGMRLYQPGNTSFPAALKILFKNRRLGTPLEEMLKRHSELDSNFDSTWSDSIRLLMFHGYNVSAAEFGTLLTLGNAAILRATIVSADSRSRDFPYNRQVAKQYFLNTPGAVEMLRANFPNSAEILEAVGIKVHAEGAR